MSAAPTPAQVLALAPDASAQAAARKLATSKPWQRLGRDAGAIWGECQGSALYQVRVDLGDLVSKCTCPSRKLPCKHGLGLLLLFASTPSAVPEGARPGWVAEWLTKRGEAARAKEDRAARRAEDVPPDPEAQAKRIEQREKRIDKGLDALERFLVDIVTSGVGGLDAQPPAFWDGHAARLVDAQAPARASRVRAIGEQVGVGPDWAARTLQALGRLALLVHAYRRQGSLDGPLREDVRQLVGWTLERDEVLARGETVSDRWSVVGVVTESDERVRSERIWLRGHTSRRAALVLQFAVGPQPFPERFAAGSAFDADLTYWPGAAPERALVRERRGALVPQAPTLVGDSAIGTFLDSFATLLGRRPWTERTCAALAGVVPAALPDGSVWLQDSAGDRLPLAPGNHLPLVAIAGGHPVEVGAEWNGRALHPLGVLCDGTYHALAAASTEGASG